MTVLDGRAPHTAVLSQERQEAADELRAVVRRFAEADGLGQARSMLDGGGYNPLTWMIMAEQLGLPGLTVSEEYDGAGAGWPELAAASEALGRSLLPSAYFATAVLATTAITLSKDDPWQRELLPSLARGERTAALAVLESTSSWDLGRIEMAAAPRGRGDGYRLNGTKLFVLDGHLADHLLVAATTELGLSLFVVAGDAVGLTRTSLPTLDPTRPQARLDFADVPARLLGVEGQAEPVLDATFDRAALALAAESVGGADHCLAMVLAHVRDRVAFGRPIGSFQAVKHKLADLYLELEFARTAVATAAAAVEAEPEVCGIHASLAFAQAVETFAAIATETIHLHGGIGFTWEHDAQLFFRRAKSSQLIFGDVSFHRERVAARLLHEPIRPQVTGGHSGPTTNEGERRG